jgi:hypothetical protein
MDQVDADSAWLAEHAEVEQQYAGEWILVEGRRVVAHDSDLAAVLKAAESRPDALLAQAYGDEDLIL